MADVQSNIKVSIDTTEALASIKNLQRQISAFHTSMAKGGAAANAVTSQMQQSLINSVNATGKFSAQMRTIKTTTESFTSSLEKNKFSMGEYFRYAGGASKTFGRLFKSEFDTINKVARENVKDLQTQYIKMGRDANGAMKAIAVRPLSLDMNDLATKTMIASQKQAILNQLLKQGSTNLLNFGKNTQWAGRQLMVGFTIPLMALGVAASKTFMDMETQAIRFKKVYGDLFTSTKESTAALEEIKLLGKEFTKYGIAVKDTVGLAAEAAAAGFKGVDLQRQTAAATRLSVLGQVESQKALETTIALQNAFSMSSQDLATNIDFLNAVENQTVLSLDDMATAIPKAAPVIQQLGGDVKDLAFFMTAMKEGGINASEGANALKSGLASMINPTGKAAAMLNSLGINIKKIVVDNKGDLKKTVIDFATALNELDPLNRAQAIEQMFGKFQFARLSTLFANVTKEGTQASRVLDLAGSSIQELAALSEKELGMTSESAMNKFKASVENLKLSLVPVGEEFLKAVTPIAEFVTKILDKFNNLGDGTKKVIVTLTAIVAGLGPVLLMTFGLLMNGLANIIKGFTFMKSLFNKTGQASTTLGTEVKYLNTEQRNAAAVAASLDQVHKKLAQTFTAEAASVDALTRAYQRSVAAQSMFMPTRVPLTMNLPTKRAKGKPAVVGGTGNKDSELALLMPGETVIPKKMSKKYGSLINGMIAGSIPGYEFGKPSPFSFGGKDFNIPQRSLPGIQRIITEAQSLSGVIGNIDDVIFTSLDRLSTEVGGSAKITAGKLQAALSPITDLARSTYAKQQTYSGNAGVVMAHGLPKTTLTPEQITGLEGLSTGTNFGPRLANRSGGPVTGLSNMVFPMPAGFNQDRMTGAEGAQWIGQNRSRFTSDIAAQAGLDPNDPDLLRFGTAVGKSLKSAAHKGVIVTQDDFEKIISDALEKEIFDVGKNTSTAVKTAFADAKKVSTIMYPEVSKASGRESYPRVAVPTAARGTTVAGVDLAKGSSYKNRAVDPAMNAQADKFTVESVRARVRQFFTKMHKGVEEEVKKVLDINSPSKVTKKLGNETATGFVHGIKELNDDAKNAGRRIGSEIVGGASQSGRTYRKATRPQGAAPIGPDMPPGTIPLTIVGMSEKEKQKARNKRGRQARYANIKKVGAKFGGVQGSVGLMGANMALSAAPDFAGKNIIQSTMTGASMGMLFGPWGAAAGAAIGLVSSAISTLIEKQRVQKAMTEAAFKSSSDIAAFFGNEIVNVDTSISNFGVSLGTVGGSLENIGKQFGYTTDELARFNDLVNSLPEGNPLKDLIAGLTDESSPEKINKIAQAFVTTQVAIGQIKPDQAQKTFDLILASSGNVAMVGSKFMDLKSQTEAVTKTLKDASVSSLSLGTTLTQLTAAAANASSLEQLNMILDGIAASGVTAAEGLSAMYYAYVQVGNLNAAQSTLALKAISGITQEQSGLIMAAVSKGFSAKINPATNAQALADSALKFLSDPKVWEKTDASTVTQKYKDLSDAQIKSTKAQIKLLKAKKKLIDDEIKKEEKITDELKKQSEYTKTQQDLDQQIVEAKIKGKYIEAASLLQEKQNNTIQFNKEQTISDLQEKSDAIQAQIDAIQAMSDDVVSAINDASAQAAAGVNKIVAAVGSITVDTEKTGTNTATATPIDVSHKMLKGYIDTVKPNIKRATLEGTINDKVATKDLDAAAAFNEPWSLDKIKGGHAQKDAFEEYVRYQLRGRLDQLKNDTDYIIVSALGKDGFTYRFKVVKNGEFIKMGDPIPPEVKKAEGGYIKNFKPGGKVKGPGTSKSDSIPAMLSNGEYVIKADSVKKYGVGYFDKLNAQKFGEGSIGGVRPTPSATSSPKTGMTSSFGSVNPSSKPTPAKTNPPKMELWDWKRQWEEANKQVINIPVSPITSNFATNSFSLNKQQRVELQSISKELISAQVKAIIVQGHTDSVGSGKDNKILSQNRANAIAEYMSKFAPGTMFVPIGYGEYKPLVPNTTAENRSKNRRADLILPNKYKTIYPDFEPEKHKFIINLGKLEGPNGTIVGGGMFIDSFNPPKEALKTFGRANGGAVKGFSVGGRILGAGTATSDSIPAYLSNGEYVIKAASVNKYGTETFDALNAGKFAKGGAVHPWWKKPATSYDSNNQPTGSPYGRYWGELERLFQGSPIGFDKNGKPIFNTTGKDPWGGTEIPGLPFSGKVGQFSDYWHQLAEQPRKSSGPGMGIDKITPPLVGSGASAWFGGLLGGGGGNMIGYHKGGNVKPGEHPHPYVKEFTKVDNLMHHVRNKANGVEWTTDTRGMSLQQLNEKWLDMGIYTPAPYDWDAKRESKNSGPGSYNSSVGQGMWSGFSVPWLDMLGVKGIQQTFNKIFQGGKNKGLNNAYGSSPNKGDYANAALFPLSFAGMGIGKKFTQLLGKNGTQSGAKLAASQKFSLESSILDRLKKVVPADGIIMNSKSAMEKLIEDVYPQGSSPFILKKVLSLPEGVGAQYHRQDLVDKYGTYALGQKIEVPLAGTYGGTVIHEFAHHLDFADEHWSIQTFLETIKDRVVPDSILKLRSTYDQANAKLPGSGTTEVNDVLSNILYKFPEGPGLYRGIQEGTATDKVAEWFNLLKDTDPKLALKFGNPYDRGAGYYYNFAHMARSIDQNTSEWRSHGLPEGLLAAGKNMPDKVVEKLKYYSEMMQKYGINPSMGMMDPAWVALKYLATRKGFANGGAVQGFWRGGLARGVSGFAKKGMNKVSPFLKQLAFAIPNKINEIKNYVKVRSMIKDGMWHGSQPTGGRGEEYLQGKNVLDGAETYDPHYGMGFFGTSSKSEADMYAAGYNSSTNWGESFGSVNKITKAPFGKYVDFTRGTNSIKWQNYKLYQALGMEKDGYLNSYLPENLGDIMAGQNVTGSIMKRISDGQVPGDMGSAKWLAWSKPAGVHTEEYTGGRYAPKKPASLLDNLKSKLSLLKKPKGFNVGGHIKGAGTATSDSIPAYLSDGEYVIKASSVKKYGTDTFDALNAQRFSEGSPGGVKPMTARRSFKLGALSGGTWQAMEEVEKLFLLHHGSNPNSSGFAKWSRAFGRVGFNALQGLVSGAVTGKNPISLLAGTAFGLGEGLVGLAKDGSQYGVKGGSYADPKGAKTSRFSPEEDLKRINPKDSGLRILESAGFGGAFGGGLNLLGRLAKAGAKKLNLKVPESIQNSFGPMINSLRPKLEELSQSFSNPFKFGKPKPVIPEAPSSLSPVERTLKDKIAYAATLSMAKINPEVTASRLAQMYPERAAQIRAKIIPNHILRKKFEEVKKISQPGSPEWEQARFELAISDALMAQQKNNVTPIMDLRTTPAQKLIDENRALPSEIKETVTIGGKEFIFKFTRGRELTSGDLSIVEHYLSDLKNGPGREKVIHGNKLRVELLDPMETDRVPAHIEYDPISGAVAGRYTDYRYQMMGLSDFLYNKAALMSRIKHSFNLTSQGKGSAHKIGGFMHDDPVEQMYTSMSDLSVLPKFKLPGLPKLNVSTLKEYLGKFTSKLKKPKKTSENTTPIDPRPIDPRNSDPNWVGGTAWAEQSAQSTIGMQATNLLEYPPLNQEHFRREVVEWYRNAYRTSANFPYGQNGYVDPMAIPELQRIMALENAAPAPNSFAAASSAASSAARARQADHLQRAVDKARQGREFWGGSSPTVATGHHMTDFVNTYLDYIDAGGHLSPIDFIETMYTGFGGGPPTHSSTGAAKGGLIKNGRLIKGFAMGGLAQSKMSIPNYKLPSYAVGSTYIPQDQIAQLHKGERVLTAQENKTYSSSAPTTNIININGSDLNKKEIAQAVMVELDRAKSKNNKTNMVGR